MSEPQREMTLIEWIDRLPKSHLARREYAALTEQLKVCEAERDKANEACRVLEELTGANNQRNRWLGVAAATALLVSERDQLREQVKGLKAERDAL